MARDTDDRHHHRAKRQCRSQTLAKPLTHQPQTCPISANLRNQRGYGLVTQPQRPTHCTIQRPIRSHLRHLLRSTPTPLVPALPQRPNPKTDQQKPLQRPLHPPLRPFSVASRRRQRRPLGSPPSHPVLHRRYPPLVSRRHRFSPSRKSHRGRQNPDQNARQRQPLRHPNRLRQTSLIHLRKNPKPLRSSQPTPLPKQCPHHRRPQPRRRQTRHPCRLGCQPR
ncbi:MAG: hypothetical protein RLZZ511_2780 [Cyanobacteriota bacterium]